MKDGIILVNKPQGWTSFDVCNKIRHLTGIKKVGHSGTLDPMATGVLPVFLGKATKSIQYFLEGDKGYSGEMTLGVRTDTGDATGNALTQVDQEGKAANDRPLPKGEGLDAIVKKYIGEIEQVPPMYSAVKINGQRLYKLARQGIEVERQPRKITIYDLQILEPVDQENLRLNVAVSLIRFTVRCSKGTYVRQLVVDIGDDLGCGAHLSKLERTYSHPFTITQTLDIVTIEDLIKISKLDGVVLAPEDFLPK